MVARKSKVDKVDKKPTLRDRKRADGMKTIVDAIRGGVYKMDDAIAMSEFSHAAVYKWIARGEEDYTAGRDTEYSRFIVDCNRMNVELKRELVGIILRAARDDDWRAAKDLLDRLDPKKQEVQLSSDPMAPFEVVFKGMQEQQCACDEDGDEIPAAKCQKVKVEDGEKDCQ